MTDRRDDALDDLLRQVDDETERVRLRGIWRELGELEVEDPPDDLAQRFAEALQAEPALRPARPLGRRVPLSVAAAALVVGVVLGALGASSIRSTGPARSSAALDADTTRLRGVVAGSLSQQPTAAARIAAVAALGSSADEDPFTLRVLVERLLVDPSVSVRLAAADALRPYAAAPTVGAHLVRALEREDEEPLVRLALIDLLVEGSVNEAVPTLQRLEADHQLDPVLHDKVLWALRQLDERRAT